MRRQVSTSRAAALEQGALPPRAAFLRGNPSPARRRGGRLFLTTALVGVGLCLAQVPAMAEILALDDGVAVTDAVIDWNREATNEVWVIADFPLLGTRAFEDGDDVVLWNFPGVTNLTLNVTEEVRPGTITVESSEYTITGAGLLRGHDDQPLRFNIENPGLVLTVDVEMAGAIVIGRSGMFGGSAGRLVYGGTATVETVLVERGATLEVNGDLTASEAEGFELSGNGATMEIGATGTATGQVRDAGDTDTVLAVDGVLDGSVSGVGSVTVGAGGDGGVVTGGIAVDAGDGLALTGGGTGDTTVGQVSGAGTVTIEGDVTATGITGDDRAAVIEDGGVFHAVNGGGHFDATGLDFDSAGTIGSANVADGVTAITADTIRLTGGAVAGDVAFDGALEVGIAGVALDGNDTLQGSLTVKDGGDVSILAGLAEFNANAAVIVVEENGAFAVSENVTNVASVDTAGGFVIDLGKTLHAGSLIVSGGETTVDGTLDTGATTTRVEGGLLTVNGTGTVGNVNVTASGDLALAGGTLGTVINRGSSTTLHGSIVSLDNKGLGTVTVDGALAVTGAAPGALINEGVLTVAAAGSLSGAGAGQLDNSGTLNLNGDAGATAIVNAGGSATLRTGVGEEGAAASIDNQAALVVGAGGRLTVAGGVTNSGTVTLGGELAGDITGGAVTINAAGTVTGNLASDGEIISRGTVTGTLAASGLARVAGEVGMLHGLTGGDITLSNSFVGHDLTLGGLQNDGAAIRQVSGSQAIVTGGAANNAAGSMDLIGSLDVTGATGGRLNNAAALDLRGTLTGDLSQTGGSTLVRRSGTVTGTIASSDGTVTVNGTAGGLDVSGGTADIGPNGEVTGTASVSGGDLTVNGTAGALGVSGGSATVAASGKVTGAASVSGGSLALDGTAGALTVTGGTATVTGSVSGATANQGGTLLVNGGALEGGLTQTGAGAGTTIDADGSVTGNVLVSGGSFDSAGTITGNLTNNATAVLAGTVTGALQGNGATTTAGDLSLGGGFALTGAGTLAVGDGHEVTLGEGAGGTLAGSSQLDIQGGTLVGDVTLNGGGTGVTLGADSALRGDVTVTAGTLTVAAIADSGATITGVVENHGLITGDGGDNVLAINGNLLNHGDILSGGGTLIVTVTGYYENFAGPLGAGVTILGDRLNSQVWDIIGDEVISGGNLLNADSGIITVGDGTLGGTLSLDGNNLTNEGVIAVTASGTIAGVDTLTNSADLTVDGGGEVHAGLIVNNGGTLTSGGLLVGNVTNDAGSFTSTGEIRGGFTNKATATLSGQADAVVNASGGVLTVPGAGGVLTADSVVNQSGGQMIVVGELVSDDVTNLAGGTFTSTGTLTGSFVNRGTATLSGAAGSVTNAAGNMSLGGDLTVDAPLVNQAGLTVGAGHTLTATGGAVRNEGGGVMTVAGTVAGGLDNAATLTVGAGGAVDSLTNEAGGTVTLRGSVTGVLTNLAGGTVDVTGPAAQVAGMDNGGHLRVGAAGHLTASGNIVNGNTALITGAVTAAALHNTGTLTSRGTLTADVVNAGIAQVSGSVVGSYANTGGTTEVVRSLDVTGPVTVSGGRMLVKSGATLTAATDKIGVTGAGRLVVTGRVEGDIDSSAFLRSDAASHIVGTVANSGTAQLAGTIDTLVNEASGTVFVHRNLMVGDLTSAGRLTVAAGRTMTVAGGTMEGNTQVAGTLRGSYENLGRLNATGTLDGLHNGAGGLTLLRGGELANAGNEGILRVWGASTIGAGGLENAGTLRLMGGARLAIGSQVHNAAGGEVIVAAASQVDGTIVNDGVLTSTGTLAGYLENNGTARLGNAAGDVVNNDLLHVRGALTVDSLTNNGTLRVGAGTVLRSDAELVTAAGGDSAVHGRLDAAMRVEDGGTLTATGRLTRTLTVAGEARLSGTAATVATETDGVLRVTGDLVADVVSNAGDAALREGVVLTAGSVENLDGGVLRVATDALLQGDVQTYEGSQTNVAGRVAGNIDNAGLLVGAGGSVSGNVILRMTGTITGSLNIEGQLIIAQLPTVQTFGAMMAAGAGDVVVLDAPGFTTFGGELDEPLATESVIEEGSVVVLADGAVIEAGGDLTVLGTLIADADNAGRLSIGVPGLVRGDIWTSGSFDLAGQVNGNVTFAGGGMSFGPTGAISGDLVLAADHGFASGEQVTAARLLVGEDVEMSLAGIGAGTGPGTLTVNADLVNNGTLALANGAVGDVVTVAGSLSGDGVYRLDTDIAAGAADRIAVEGGPVTGRLTFDIRDAASADPDFGQVATLLSWDTAYSGSNSYELADPVNLPEPNERVIYLVSADEDAGEIQLVSAANPAVGAISGNIVLTQSLIGTVINRPSSPYTTGIGFQADRACRVGSWGRAVGGNADASGATRGAVLPNGERISVDSEISADYRGFQVGTDLGCYDGRFGDWTVIGGAIVGLNTGSTTQPVYAVNPLTGRASTEMTSVNDADFDQKYAGVYVSAMKGAWVVDFQVRREWTAFTLNNTPQPGSLGLRLTDAEFDSNATTVSGSVGYSMPLGGAESGWSLTPTAGFAWTKTSTDTIVFDDNSTLELDDSETRIGFVGAGLSRTRLAEDGRSALSLFASGTWYKDFADPVESTFTLMHGNGDSSVQRLSSDNLGSFGEISFGASYVRLLEGSSPVKQLNATIRVDGRSGGTLDSYGVTGQLRLQF